MKKYNPFDNDGDKQLPVSFSKRFTSIANDVVNPETEAEVGRKMLIILDGLPVTSAMELKFMGQAL